MDGAKASAVSSLLPDWVLENKEIDTTEGLKNCSTEEAYLIVLDTFFEVISENADEIEDYYRKEDWKNYVIKVHGLKSSAKTIGAMALSEQAAKLEKAGLENDIATIKRDTEALLLRYRSLPEG